MGEAQTSDSSSIGGWLRLGNYFQLISIVPGAVVVLPVVALLASGAPGSRPSGAALRRAMESAGIAEWAILSLSVITVGMMIHPFQFALIQRLEGYWGPRPVATHLMHTRAALHLHRRRHFEVGVAESNEATKALLAEESLPGPQADTEPGVPWPTWTERSRLEANLEADEYQTALGQYPEDEYRTLPTRLGNTLRSYEDAIGAPYALDVIAVAPHLMLIADRSHTDLVDDARGDLDLAVRFVFSWLVLAAASFLLLWPHGAWLLVPIASYGAAWASYHAAVAAAHEYGTALRVLVDLNHQKLAVHMREVDPLEPRAGLNRMLSNLAARQ